MNGRIVVLGGSGAVGRVVAADLARDHPGQVVVTSRDPQRARATAAALPRGVTPAVVDLADPSAVEPLLADARVVVQCIEQADVEVARRCVARGVHHIDISATTAVVSSIGELDGLARRHGAVSLVSVGLAPGLTNLLAREVAAELPDASSIDVTLCFGLGGDHGPDSRRWILDGLGAPVGSARRAVVDLPGLGRRTAHPFPFSDQDVLTADLGVAVTTRLCFDSRAVTAAAFGAQRRGILPLLHRRGLTARLDGLLGRLAFGDDRFVLHVAAANAAGERVVRALCGRGEARATGIVTAAAVRLVGGGSLAPGVHHLHQVAGPGWLRSVVADAGLTDHHPPRGDPPHPMRRRTLDARPR